MMIDLILDLYTEYGYKNIFIRDNDVEDDNGEDVSIRLITPNGDMYFTYDDGKIYCEFYQELDSERIYHNNTLDTCDDVLDWIARKSKYIKRGSLTTSLYFFVKYNTSNT